MIILDGRGLRRSPCVTNGTTAARTKPPLCGAYGARFRSGSVARMCSPRAAISAELVSKSSHERVEGVPTGDAAAGYFLNTGLAVHRVARTRGLPVRVCHQARLKVESNGVSKQRQRTKTKGRHLVPFRASRRRLVLQVSPIAWVIAVSKPDLTPHSDTQLSLSVGRCTRVPSNAVHLFRRAR